MVDRRTECLLVSSRMAAWGPRGQVYSSSTSKLLSLIERGRTSNNFVRLGGLRFDIVKVPL